MALEDVRTELSKLIAIIKSRMGGSAWIYALVEAQRLCRAGEASQLIRALRSWPGAAEFDRIRRHFGSSAHSLDIEELAEWMLLRGAVVGVDETCTQLHEYSERRDYELPWKCDSPRRRKERLP